MDLTVVKANTGRELGSAPARRMRTAGAIPGVVYGMGKDPVAVSVDYVELRAALKTDHGLNTVIGLDIDGSTETVLVNDIQRDVLKRTVSHADFLRVDPDVPVKVIVPVHLVGKAIAVADAGALVEQKMHTLLVKVKPSQIPVSIEVDISAMTIESRMQLSELTLPDGVEPLVGGNITVAAPVATRVSKTAAEEEAELLEEGEEGAEGEEGTDAEASSDDEAGEE